MRSGAVAGLKESAHAHKARSGLFSHSTSTGKVACVGFVVGAGLTDPDHIAKTLRDRCEQLRLRRSDRVTDETMEAIDAETDLEEPPQSWPLGAVFACLRRAMQTPICPKILPGFRNVAGVQGVLEERHEVYGLSQVFAKPRLLASAYAVFARACAIHVERVSHQAAVQLGGDLPLGGFVGVDHEGVLFTSQVRKLLSGILTC